MKRQRRWAGLVVLFVLVLAAGWPPNPPPAAARAAGFSTPPVYFPETGHHLGGEFLTFWLAGGGMRSLGYPISEPLVEDGLVVQYFERARLEFHQDRRGTPEVVQVTLLGRWLAQGREDEPPFRPLRLPGGDRSDPDHAYFYPETGHWLAAGFRAFWEANGGLRVFGYPISEEFAERNPDTGQVHTVQYFERARFEFHPEHRGTPDEVLLGRLGVEAAALRGVDAAPVPQRPDAVTVFPAFRDPLWARALRTGAGHLVGVVAPERLDVRAAPDLDAPVVATTFQRHPLTLQGMVRGDAVDGAEAWYRVGADRYVPAAQVAPFVPPAPPVSYPGRWVDINLTHFYAVAYDGARPLYAAIVTAGRDNRTPRGVFQVLRRVRNETMDASTVGVSPGDPDFYYLENVEFTQYFQEGGYALHGNWWTPPEQYGNFTSHGCVGLLNPDAEWFWNFLDVGSTVTIHE